MNSGKIAMSAAMLAIFAVMVAIATQYPPQARFMPLVVGIPGIVLCAIQLFIEIRARRRPIKETVANDSIEAPPPQFAAALETTHAQQQPGGTQREIALWLSFIALVAALILFGFWVTIPVYLMLFMRYYAKESWRFALLAAGLSTGVLYLLFAKGLKVTLHGGFVTTMLLDIFGSK